MVQELNDSAGKRTLVGLTGTFGSGKSAVTAIFENLGAFTLNADEIAHEALLPGTEVFSYIEETYPGVIVNGGVDRKKLAAEVFSDHKKKNELESRIHPYVFEQIRERVSKSSQKLVVLEVPLLFETGYERQCDVTVCVTANPDIIRERLKAKGFGTDEIEARNRAQLEASEKEEKADFIIDNSASLNETVTQVKEILSKIKKNSKGVS